MRVLLAVVVLLMAVLLISFSLQNTGTRVDVMLFGPHRGVGLPLVVFVAFLIGACAVGIVAVAEGALTRLANRRLRRDVHKLETEVNYLRTQPAAGRPALELPEPGAPPARRPSAPPGTEIAPPSAPVYEAAEDIDDDVYSGGRAV